MATSLKMQIRAGSNTTWSAVKQKSITLSSTEAEYYAMTHAFKKALWLCVFLSFLNLPVPHPFPILSDNQAACSLSNSTAISIHSKHIDICHFIHAHILDGSFVMTWVLTADMPADIFTKPLSSILFLRHECSWTFYSSLLFLTIFFHSFLIVSFHYVLLGVC